MTRARRELLIDQQTEQTHQVNVLASRAAADVMGLTGSAVVQHRIDAAAMIGHVQSVAGVATIVIHRERWPASSCAFNNGINFSTN
jgi:hypothetical protein